jgi:hypothetical protein
MANLSGTTGGATISDAQGIGTITNNDAANQPPDAGGYDTVAAVNQYTNMYVLTTASDPDGGTLSIIGLANDTGLNASISCGGTCIRVMPSGIHQYTVTYTVSDGQGGTDTGVLSVRGRSFGPPGGGGEF